MERYLIAVLIADAPTTASNQNAAVPLWSFSAVPEENDCCDSQDDNGAGQFGDRDH
jgi:hypothetical protein